MIVVDDGSNDGTTEVAVRYSKLHGSDKVRVLKLKENRGKGGAVRMVRAQAAQFCPGTHRARACMAR